MGSTLFVMQLVKNNIILAILLLNTVAVNAEVSIPKNLPQKPNIVYFLIDDLGYGDLKAFNPDSKLELPTIDRLANEGRIFTDAHSPAAACAPSRYPTLTGNNTWRGQYEWGTWGYYGVGSQILEGQWTLSNILKQAGYNTAMIGKYHLGGDVYSKDSDDLAFWSDDDSTLDFSRPVSSSANDIGFDFSYLNISGVQAPPYAFFRNGLLVGEAGNMINWLPGQYGNSNIRVGGIGISTWDTSQIETTLLDEAKQFIQQSRNTTPEAPFFLYLPLPAIHSPHTPPFTFAGEPVLGQSGIGDKGDMVHVVDLFVREVLATLEAEGILDETLIIFTSDNGSLKPVFEQSMGHDASGGLRGSKLFIYEGGHRVPLIMKWGDGSQSNSFIPTGSSSNALIGIQDIFAMIAQLADVELPADQARDSVNITPALFANNLAEQSRRETLLSISSRNLAGEPLPRDEYYYAIRENEWKLILHYKQSDPENPIPLSLYNLENDLHETTDLITDPQYADKAQAMLSEFIIQRTSDRTAPIFILDIDGDEVSDTLDNCKLISNTSQMDSDANGIGDACEPPRINGFWSISTEVNSSVFVFGDHFDTSNTQININGISAPLVQVISKNMLIFILPEGDTNGTIEVTTTKGSVSSIESFGSITPSLSISGIWPGQASTGDFVFVFGSEFEPTSTQTKLNSNLMNLVQIVNSNMLIFMVPANATTGSIEITTTAGTVTSANSLEISP